MNKNEIINKNKHLVYFIKHFNFVIEDSSPNWEKSNQKKKIELQSSFGSRSFGNRISVQEVIRNCERWMCFKAIDGKILIIINSFLNQNDSSITTNEMTSSFSSSNPPKDTTRHLKGNWSVYWDHEIGRSETKFNFKQIKLQAFSGHTASVRSIWSLNNENSFLTGSKDRTCRVFSLRNQVRIILNTSLYLFEKFRNYEF